MAATYDAAKTTAKKAAAVGVIGAEGTAVVGGGVTVAGVLGAKAILSPYANAATSAYRAVNRYFHPAHPVKVPCIKCLGQSSAQERAARIRNRNALIHKAMAGHDPAAKAKAAQLKHDMVAVEMARLSENAYAQSYTHPPGPATAPPPSPWKAMSPDDVKRAGIDPQLLRDSKATIYQLPADFPMQPKTVVAFRGTTGETEDIVTDHDQALGLYTPQYKAAETLGNQVGDVYPDAQVTGHSLGGGKAQAAGIAGNLKGMMFNSAGLNPQTMGATANGLDKYSGDFLQYRAEGGITSAGGDPLTGIQNSPGTDDWARKQLGMDPVTSYVPEGQRDLATQLSDRLQHVTSQQAAKNYQFSGGKWYLPPAVGQVKGLTSKNADGSNTAAANQHSITNLVNGFEYRKFNNIEALLKATNTPGNAASYLGPTEIQMR